jgi:hypothetical protein
MPGTLRSRNPATGAVLGSVEATPPERVEDAVEAARRVQPLWALLRVEDRARNMRRVAAAIIDEFDELLLGRERPAAGEVARRPPAGIDARSDATRAGGGWASAAVGIHCRWRRRRRGWREPFGVAGVIGPAARPPSRPGARGRCWRQWVRRGPAGGPGGRAIARVLARQSPRRCARARGTQTGWSWRGRRGQGVVHRPGGRAAVARAACRGQGGDGRAGGQGRDAGGPTQWGGRSGRCGRARGGPGARVGRAGAGRARSTIASPRTWWREPRRRVGDPERPGVQVGPPALRGA